MKHSRRQIVIIGGGFGGLSCAKSLKNADADVTLIDKANHHLFQPLLYQVATAALSPGDIAAPLRGIVGNKGIRVILGEVSKISPDKTELGLSDGRFLKYDQLVLAAGTRYNYFGNDHWKQHAPGLKTIGDALRVRERILLSLEEADQITDIKTREPYLTYVIIGGGPTGVETAGAIAEIAKRNIMRDYSNISKNETRIFLVEAAPNILNGYPKQLRESARSMLENMGVRVLVNTPVTDIKENKVLLGNSVIDTPNIIWAAGVTASALVKSLDAEHDRNGRIYVNKDLSISSDPNIFVIGDAAHFKDDEGTPLPALAPVAAQQGRYVGKLLRQDPEKHHKPVDFRYVDKGTMATIGRAKAVASIKGFKFSGFAAWIVWSVVHILFLIGFRNRFRVFMEWIWYYFTFKRGVRLITDRSEYHKYESHNQNAS